MFVIYAGSLVLWLMLMDVGAEKSWRAFNISEGKSLIQLLLRCGIAALITWFLVSFMKYEGRVDPSGAVIAPFSTAFYYAIHILFNRKHREHWREYLKVDRWNAVALLGCFVVALVSSVLR